VRLVLSEAALLLVLGALAGLPFAFAIDGTIRGVLFGVEPGNWVSVAAAIAVLAAVAGVAAWVPARRAARVDPLVALKAE
jgi:putative ABC transport system permease protein